jgi:hypothetical protein
VVKVNKPKAAEESRIAGMVIMLRTPLNGNYRTTELKTRQLGELLRTVFTAIRNRGAQRGQGKP